MTDGRFSNDELKQLYRQALEQDGAAWEKIFRGLYGLFKSQALGVGLRDDDVDDAIGEMMKDLVDRIRDFAEARDPLAYTASAARYAAMGVRKNRNRVAAREKVAEEGEGMENPMDQKGTNAQQRTAAISAQVRTAIAEALGEMSEAALAPVYMHYRDDLSYEEISYILGSEAGAIRVAVHRTLGRLKRRLEEKLGESLGKARLGPVLRRIDLPDPPPIDFASPDARRLRRWIQAPDALSEEDRQEVEDRLATDQSYRRLRVLIDRRLVAETDVRAHSGDGIPSGLLMSLMEYARQARPQQED